MTASAPPRRRPAPPAKPPVPIDPRIRERRIVVKREEGRRRLRALLAVLGVAALAAAGVAATRSPLLDVDRIVVHGAERTGADAVRRATGVELRDRLVDVRPGRAAVSVERLPWVRGATVAVRWPSAIEVTVIERDPLVAVAVPSPPDPATPDSPAPPTWVVVAEDGVATEATPTRLEGLIAVRGDVDAPRVGSNVGPDLAGAVQVARQLGERLRGVVEAIEVGEDGLVLVLRDAPRARLGPATQVGEKLTAVATLLAKTDLRGAVEIDARVPSAPVLTRR